MIQCERAGEQGNYMLKTDPAEKLKSIEKIQSWFKDNLHQEKKYNNTVMHYGTKFNCFSTILDGYH